MADGGFDHPPVAGLPALPATAAWVLAMTQPRKEAWAEANLNNQGYATFLPKIRRSVSHARKRRETLAPLFPRYVFAAVDFASQPWRPILGTFGVSALVMEGARPRRAPRGLVETLAAAGGASGDWDYSDRLSCGQKVRFLSGPFADAAGRLTSLGPDGRVRVLLEVLGAEREISAGARNLIPAG